MEDEQSRLSEDRSALEEAKQTLEGQLKDAAEEHAAIAARVAAAEEGQVPYTLHPRPLSLSRSCSHKRHNEGLSMTHEGRY